MGGNMHLSANGHRVHISLTGPESAPAVVLCHALGARLALWDPQITALSGRYRLIAYDLRGHGDSEVAPGPYGLDDLADDAAALCTALGVDRFSFVGLSIGGMIGQHLALRHGDRLDALVLAASCCALDAGARDTLDDRIALVAANGMAAQVTPTLERWFTAAYRNARPAEMAEIAAMLRATSVDGYVGCSQAIRALDTEAELGRVRVPTLVISGAADPAMSPAHGRHLAAAIPGAAFEVIDDAAHLCNREQATVFNRLLGDFLDRHHREAMR